MGEGGAEGRGPEPGAWVPRRAHSSPQMAARGGHWLMMPSRGQKGPDERKGLTLPRQVLLAVLRLLGDPHLRQDESGPVPDLGNSVMREGLRPRSQQGARPARPPHSRCSASAC